MTTATFEAQVLIFAILSIASATVPVPVTFSAPISALVPALDTVVGFQIVGIESNFLQNPEILGVVLSPGPLRMRHVY